MDKIEMVERFKEIVFDLIGDCNCDHVSVCKYCQTMSELKEMNSEEKKK